MVSDSSKHKFRRILGVHACGHDANIAVVVDGNVSEIVEFERLYQEKRYRIYPDSERFDRALQWVFESYGLRRDFDAVAIQFNQTHDELYDIAVAKLRRYIGRVPCISFAHHQCHAAAAYFTSPFARSAILSIDGRGGDGCTVAFVANGSDISYLRKWPFSLGMAYRALGQIIGGIHAHDLEISGKTMGLTAYGQVIPGWKRAVKTFITSYRPRRDQLASWEPAVADGCFFLDGFGPVVGTDTFGGPKNRHAQNFAATFQECWSEIVVDIVSETIKQSQCNTVCITGGAALNAITNKKILEIAGVEQVHFIPNPNDAGLAMGAALQCYYGNQQASYRGRRDSLSPYLGLPVLDSTSLPRVASERGAKWLTNPASSIAALLADGLVVGIIQGRSEIGPRALGNRSILCDPRKSSMKAILNNRVKGREWYRPFAPVTRVEEQATYFDVMVPVPYMSVIGHVRNEWTAKIPAVTHVDGTARLQSVSEHSNKFLWELIGCFKALTGIGVLLNTSFNGKATPMITTVSGALKILDETELDAVYAEGWLFEKKGSSRREKAL